MGLRRCISSMKSTSFLSSEVSTPAKSPGLSSTGPEVTLKPTPNSLAMMFDSVVFPNPGGPCSNTWSSASLRIRAAMTNTFRFSTTFACPLKSRNESGRNTFSYSRSLSGIRASLMSKSFPITDANVAIIDL